MSTSRPVVVHHPDEGPPEQPAPDSERLQQCNFVFVPPHMVHRETTGSDADLEAFVIRIGWRA